MSVIAAALKHMLAAGMTHDAIVSAVEAMEAARPAEKPRSKGAERQARYEERKRQRASESVSSDDPDVRSSECRPLPSSPQTPQLPTPTHGDINTHTRESGADFDLFWTAYPRKVGKDDARKKFAAAIRGGATIGQLVAGVNRDRQRQWLDRPPDMVPHPATWLHQGRWKDEPDQHQPQAQGHPHERRQPPSDKFERRQANLERALTGFDLAVGLRAEQSEGGF